MSTQEPGEPSRAGADAAAAARGHPARERARSRPGRGGVRRLPASRHRAPGAASRAPGGSAERDPEPSGHAVRMDALHLIRSAAEFADTIERDAQEAAAKQVGKAEQEIRERRWSSSSARPRSRASARRPSASAARSSMRPGPRPARSSPRRTATRPPSCATPRRGEAGSSSSRATRRPSSRTPLAPRSSRRSNGHARRPTIVQRARMGAEQLLSAAGHGDAAIHEAIDAIVKAAESSVAASARP